MKTLAVITSQFPEMHETFVARELLALRNAGVKLRIYSLKPCRDRIVHPDARTLLDLTTYVAWNDPATWGRALVLFLRRPMIGIRTLCWTVRHHSDSVSALGKALVIWMVSMALAEKITQDGAAHVHAHWATMPTSAAFLVSMRLGIPFSFTAHAWDIFVRNASLKEKMACAKSVFTCTDFNRRRLTELCPEAKEKIVLNYHGVDMDRFNGCAAGRNAAVSDLTFLSVGRLVETKGYDVLLEAYRRLARHTDGFRAWIVGSGPLKHLLERKIEQSGLTGQVALRDALGQDELVSLYQSARALVQPSVVAPNGDRDGIPNVILEAMAMARPVISTAVSGIPEAVKDGETGILVAAADPERLERALQWVWTHPEEAAALGRAGKRRAAELFAQSSHMKQLVGSFKLRLLAEENEAKPS